MSQVDELIGGYDFEGVFYDMTFWPAVCVCDHCRARLRQEDGLEIPDTMDWTSEIWCSFQAARERWINEFAADLTSRSKQLRPGISVYHNFACALLNWTLGLPFSSAVHHDFLGADFYGDPLEQLVVSKLMMGLTEDKPIEFMTSCCVDLGDHVRLKRREEMLTQAYASSLFGGAFLFIDAINPDGTVNTGVYERMGDIYRETSVFEPYLGGNEVSDIGVYFSDVSKMSFKENGLPLTKAPMWGRDYPHLAAVRGACKVLQQAHLPFGVITKKDLPNLANYKVVVLPNVLRMDPEECEALREYVRGGGRLYASRYTSLTETKGVRHDDFMLSEVFGCHFQEEDAGAVAYIKPLGELSNCAAPQSYISHFSRANEVWGVVGLAERVEGRVLSTLTLPYGDTWGSVFEQNWSSIHSSPPWRDTDAPAIVENSMGDGRCVYSAADIECVASEASEKLFLAIIQSLLPEQASYNSEAHPSVWMSVFDQPDERRLVVGFLNCQSQHPTVPIDKVPFELRCPDGRRFTRLTRLPNNQDIKFTLDADGTLHSDAGRLEVFALLAADY